MVQSKNNRTMKIRKPTEMAKKANETKDQGLWDETVLGQRRKRGRRFSWNPPKKDSDSESVNIQPALIKRPERMKKSRSKLKLDF